MVILKELFKEYLKTNDGKRDLQKVLKNQYISTVAGTTIDQIKDDLADISQKYELIWNYIWI